MHIVHRRFRHKQNALLRPRPRDRPPQIAQVGLVRFGRAPHNDGSQTRMPREQRQDGVNKNIGAFLMPNAPVATDEEGVGQAKRVAQGAARCGVGRRAEGGGVDAVQNNAGGAGEVVGAAARGGDDGVHAADEKSRPPGVAALRCGSKQQAQAAAKNMAEDDSEQHFNVAAGVPDAPSVAR